MTTQALNQTQSYPSQRHDIRPSAPRGAGAVLAACGVASVLLLLSHPDGGGSHALADVLRREAAQALSDAIVHGSFVLVLAVELVCFAVLAVRVGLRRPAVLAAMVFALVGAGLLGASMVLDGLVTPAVAARYLAAPPERLEEARGLLVLIGAAIGALMPMGLAFQGAAALAWGAALAPMPGRAPSRAKIGGLAALVSTPGHAPNRVKIGGLAALALGLAILAASAFSVTAAGGMIGLMIALVAMAAWALAAGVLLWGWRDAPIPG